MHELPNDKWKHWKIESNMETLPDAIEVVMQTADEHQNITILEQAYGVGASYRVVR